jgi:DNA-binding ferritin-like protein
MFIIMHTLVFIKGQAFRLRADGRDRCRTLTAPSSNSIIEEKEHTMPDINTDLTKAARDIAAVAKDATYVVIGAGVLGFQQAQVQRQELLKRLSDPKADLGSRVNSVRSDVNGALHGVDSTVEGLMERFEEVIQRLEAAVAPLEDRLPTQARDVARQAHVQAKEARTQLRSRIPTVAA